jgi:hypothetical protein
MRYLHFIHIPIFKLGTPHAVHVVFHGKVVFHRARGAVTAIDLVDTTEAVAHQAEYPFLVVPGAIRVSRACGARAFVKEHLHFLHLVFGGQLLDRLHGLVKFIHTMSP